MSGEERHVVHADSVLEDDPLDLRAVGAGLQEKANSAAAAIAARPS
jgi:hypothetical protein